MIYRHTKFQDPTTKKLALPFMLLREDGRENWKYGVGTVVTSTVYVLSQK